MFAEPTKSSPNRIGRIADSNSILTTAVLFGCVLFSTARPILADSSSAGHPSGDVGRVRAEAAAEETGGPAGAEQDRSGISRQQALIASLTIFVLAIFVGFEVITKVPPTLHTPLMSGSNAISGITIVGALIAAGGGLGAFPSFLGLLALILAAINVVGGFMVTGRMLAMFQKKKA